MSDTKAVAGESVEAVTKPTGATGSGSRGDTQDAWRGRRGYESAAEAEAATQKLLASGQHSMPSPGAKKRKVALCLGYLGSNFYGMQKNDGFRTVESELWTAICKAGGVHPLNAAAGQENVGFQRCARTDRGVHAAAAVVSLKLMVDQHDEALAGKRVALDRASEPRESDEPVDKLDRVPVEQLPAETPANEDDVVLAADATLTQEQALQDAGIVARINECLPDDVHVFGLRRTLGGFSSWKDCTSRTYEYLMPTYVLAPWSQFADAMARDQAEDSPAAVAPSATDADDNNVAVAGPHLRAALRAYRVTDAQVARVRRLLAKYQGTHNFHNFTSGMRPDQAQAKRHIIGTEVLAPVLASQLGQEQTGDGIPSGAAANGGAAASGDTEWLRVRYHGQSFVFHQIRKMTGLVVQMVRDGLPDDDMALALGMEKRGLPVAPGMGLLLNECHFSCYEGSKRRFSHQPSLAFRTERPAIERFKFARIYPRIVSQELEENQFVQWCAIMHTYPINMHAVARTVKRAAPATRTSASARREGAGNQSTAHKQDGGDGDAVAAEKKLKTSS